MSIEKYFKQTIDRGASDLHLIEGSIPRLRVNGTLIEIEENVIRDDYIKKEIFSILSEELKEQFNKELDLDFSHEYFDHRFRINLHYQQG